MINNKYIWTVIVSLLLAVGIASIISNYSYQGENAENTATHNVNQESVLAINDTPTPTNDWYDIEPFSLLASPTPLTTLPTPTNNNTSGLSINFVDLPKQVRSGQSFKVIWKVDGPSGIQGEDTNLDLSYKVTSVTSNSSASSSSKSSQSFGSFTLPQTFDSNFKFSGESGIIHLTITARVNGQILSTQDSIQLVN